MVCFCTLAQAFLIASLGKEDCKGNTNGPEEFIILEFAKVIYIFESFKVKLKGGEVMSVKSLQFVNGFQNASIYAKI